MKTKSVDTMDSFILVVQAKQEWPDNAVPQIITEAVKKRLAAGKRHTCLLFLPMGRTFAALSLILMVVCMLRIKSFLDLKKTELMGKKLKIRK
jgi:hypothetical protein